MLSRCTGVSEDSVMNLNRSIVRMNLSENTVPTWMSVSCLHLFRFSPHQFVRSFWLTWTSGTMKTDTLNLGFGQNPTRQYWSHLYSHLHLECSHLQQKIKAVVCPWDLNMIRCLTFVEMLLTTENWFFVCWFPKVSRILSLDVIEALQYSLVLMPKICGFLSQ